MIKQGIKELEDVMKLAIGMANAGVKIGEDGKVDLNDLGTAMGVLPLFPAAIDGIDKLPAEVSDLDSAEGLALLALVEADLMLPPGKAKPIVMASVKLALALSELIAAIAAPSAVAPQA